jgi:RHS repeat-associated protein
LGTGGFSGTFYKYNYFGRASILYDVAEYDYGSVQSSCTQPTSNPVRETKTPQYHVFEPGPGTIFDIKDRPDSVQIFGNGTLQAETDYIYDGTAVQPVSPAPIGHDGSAYGAGSHLPNGDPVPRGNPTTITRKCHAGSSSCTDSITNVLYDETGLPVSVTDPRGYTIQYSFNDSYTTDDGTPPPNTNTHTYLTQITRPPTGNVNHTESFTWDYYKGEVRTDTDVENGTTTSYNYDDPWLRPTDIYSPPSAQNGNAKAHTHLSYVDGSSPTITTQGPTGVTTVKSYDGMKHLTRTQVTSGPSAPSTVDMTYDGSGRPLATSMPYGPSDSTYGVTQYVYDLLGRKTSETAPYNAQRMWDYSGGNTVKFTDEAGNQWLQTTDALGRLTAVKEPNGTAAVASMETDYTYDANNNLTQVDQWGGAQGSTGEVKRTFNYDTLSRLLCASNPESASNPTSGVTVQCPMAATTSPTPGTLGYSYDPSGNMMTRTDARGIMTTYNYDALNRVITKSYVGNGNTPSVSFTYDTGVLGITGGHYVGRLTQVKTMAGSSLLYNYSTAGYDEVGRPMGYVECPGVSDCTAGAAAVLGANYVYDLAGNPTQVTSQGTMAVNGTIVGGVNQRNYMYDTVSHLSTVTADARLVGAQDAGATTLFASPTYNAAGQLTAASLAVNPSTQQSMIGLNRTYDLRLRPLSESDAGQVGTPGTPATATVNVTGTEKSIGGSGTPAQAAGTISLSYAGGALVKEGAGALHPIPLLVGSSITLPDGYHAAFTPSTNSALATANSLTAVLNGAYSPVTAVVASGGTARAASVILTTKATGVAQNGAITLRLVGTQVTAAPASLSGGSGTAYDAGTVTVTVNNASLTTNYGQLSTPQTVAQGLASAIIGANLGVTASAGSNGALTVTANQAGTADNGMAVTLVSSSSEPGLFSSPSFNGTSGSLGGGTDGTFSPGTIYSYSIPSPGTPTTGYAGNGNLLSFTDLINGQWTATYDTLNRVLTATVAGTPSTTLTWSYDAFGNRQPQGPNGGTLNYPPGNNRISGSGYTYDASGNITEDPSNQYAYDGEGRLCTVYNKTLFTYTGYAYDGLGNRVARGTATNGLSCDNTFTASYTFVVGSSGEQLDEMNANGAVYSNVFANGQLLATYQFPTSKWTFALNDWLGTKRFVANAEGTRAETCTGLPFGDGPPCTGTGDPSPQHFTGKERDPESNNDYFGARYYSSNTGRFISPDWSAKLAAVPYAKLGNPQTLNLYSYVGNNPLSAVDPDGHDKTPGGTQCGQVVSIACNNSGNGPAGEALAEFRAAEAQQVAQEEAPEAERELKEELDARSESALKPLKPGEKVGETGCPGCILPGQKGPLDPAHAKNFKWYIPVELKSPETYYRQWGDPAGPTGKHGGTYYSFFPPEGSEDLMREQMSLPKEWNSMEHTDAVTIPAGRTVYIGPAAAQAGYPYPGGGIQVFVPNP